MTLEEMKVARNHGESKTDWALLIKNQQAGIEPEEDDESPDATELMREVVNKLRVGRPSGGNKEQIALRIDRDILNSFRATGKGWQTLMNKALREWLQTHHI
jgi:uncharacterized protein (DUF4415 family)